MKKTFLMSSTLILALAWLGSAAQASTITAIASLDYAQEVAPSNPDPSDATGSAKLYFDLAAGTLDINARVEGIFVADVTFPDGGLAFGAQGPFHIHEAPAGANGPIVVPFPEAAFFTDTDSGMRIQATGIAFDPALVSSLMAGDLYLNLHSLDYGSGEIRGQLAAVPLPAPATLLAVGLLLLAVRRR
jgi:hypothetical protein